VIVERAGIKPRIPNKGHGMFWQMQKIPNQSHHHPLALFDQAGTWVSIVATAGKILINQNVHGPCLWN
jgi:hypothetical protein